jgi:hypothetical protein
MAITKHRLINTSITNQKIAEELSEKSGQEIVIGGENRHSFLIKLTEEKIGSRVDSLILDLEDKYPALLEAAKEFSSPL